MFGFAKNDVLVECCAKVHVWKSIVSGFVSPPDRSRRWWRRCSTGRTWTR